MRVARRCKALLEIRCDVPILRCCLHYGHSGPHTGALHDNSGPMPAIRQRWWWNGGALTDVDEAWSE